jgi:hypothetical protein
MSANEIDDDTPLSVAPEPSAFVRDTTRPLDAATFSPLAFLDGFRPTRRTVKLHERADLIGDLDEIANRIDSLPEDADVDDLIAEFHRVRDIFQASVCFWTVERRSSEWVTERWATYAREHGIKLDSDGDTDNPKHRLNLLIDQLVGQIIEVKDLNGRVVEQNVNHERLRRLYDSNEGELNKLLFAQQDANTSLAQSAKVLTRDFSLRSSTARSGAAS